MPRAAGLILLPFILPREEAESGRLIGQLGFGNGRRFGGLAGPDPWGGDTLEWATSSPPPPYDFVEIPTVRSVVPVWDQPELREGAIRAQDRLLAAEHETMSTTLLDADPELLLPMPEESFAPVATAFGPRCATQKTSTTANTDSITISITIGMARRMIARPIGPAV